MNAPGYPASTCCITGKIPEGPIRDFWSNEIVAKGDELCAKYKQGRNYLPAAPNTTEDPAFLEAVEERGSLYIEERWAKPPGYAAIPRKFYDANAGMKGAINTKIAESMAGIGRNGEGGYLKLKQVQEILKRAVQEILSSHLKLKVNAIILSKQIRKSDGTNGTVSNIKELQQEFYRNPTVRLCNTIFVILHVDTDTKLFWCEVLFHVIHKLKIWYSPSAFCDLSKKGRTGSKPSDKACAGFIVSQAKSTLNDNFRKKFNQGKAPHGISISKSRDKKKKPEENSAGQRLYPRATNATVFVFEKHVKNWN